MRHAPAFACRTLRKYALFVTIVPRSTAGGWDAGSLRPLVKGRSFEQKKALVQDITSAVMKHLNAPADAVVVSIIETDADSKGKGGVMFSERGR